MTARYLYIKFTGFLLVIIGLSYSITSFVNMFSYLYGNIVLNGSNTIMMILGTIIPLYIFIFGIFYFMYTDSNITKINKKILVCSIIMIILGILLLIFKINYLVLHAFKIAQIFYFLHFSLGIVAIVLGIMVLFSCLKYKL